MVNRQLWRVGAALAVATAFLVPAGARDATPVAKTAPFAAPVVKTVPWVATNPLIAHDTYPGKR